MRRFGGRITQTGNIATIKEGGGTLDQVVGLRSHNDAVALPDGCLADGYLGALHERSLASLYEWLARRLTGMSTHLDLPGGMCLLLYGQAARAHCISKSQSCSHLTHFVVRQQQLAPARWYDCVITPDVCCRTQFRDTTGFLDGKRSRIYSLDGLCY